MASTSFDVTLMGFNAVDLRDINVGDVVVFRSTSITHSKALPLRHGRTAKVTGFSRNRAGTQQVDVAFLADAGLGDDLSKGKLTQPIGLAPGNLVKKTDQSIAAGKQAHELVEAIRSQCAEQKRPWLAVPKLQIALGEAGMYDRLGQPQQTQSVDDLPY